MLTRHHFAAILFVFALVAAPAWGQDQTEPAPPTPSADAPAPDREALEKAFSEKLSGAALVGRFTVDGRGDENLPRPERYEIESVTKTPQGDLWLFVARVKYGDKDVKIPMVLKVLWAGDTPVITLSDFTIPVLGTFTARVLFHGDRYVGTWQHGEVGGHMWGRIEKIEPEPNGKEKPQPSDNAK